MEQVLERWYRRLGAGYLRGCFAVWATAGMLFPLAGAFMLSLHVPLSLSQFVLVTLIATLVSGGAGIWGGIAGRRFASPLRAWLRNGDPKQGAEEAWDATVRLPRVITGSGLAAGLLLALPASIVMGRPVLGLTWGETAILFGAAGGLGAWGAINTLFLWELLLNPLLADTAHNVPPDFRLRQVRLPLRRKIMAGVLAISFLTAGMVPVLVDHGASLGALAVDGAVALAVTATLSLALTSLVVRPLLAPLERLYEATRDLAGGKTSVRVPVVSDDELGTLSSSFNEMVAAMAERTTLREVVRSYVHPEVARRVIREGAQLEGREAEVTALFVDIRDFTSYAESVTPRQAVALLNEFFELAVTVLVGHGGHANKFIGDGLLAAFGAHAELDNHAAEAVEAACELVEAVERAFHGELRIGIGINTGHVLAGTIGGGGKLEFTVIGDTVNVAARVEQLTKTTGDPVLLTEDTYRQLGDLAPLVEARGEIELRGKAKPVPIFAPKRLSKPRARPALQVVKETGLEQRLGG